MSDPNKEYLGDSVYITVDDEAGGIVLTTENGMGPSNIIFMDWNTVSAMTRYIDTHQGAK